ncbi:monovalent cation/H(+) antiporter subunit G [Sphaerobacter sp.]|uniref:monovalent cation/H(+) antiporter subunit G n=1 Tax=Sphaerobacter sp. TaxID=2099654 RepID=UPI001DF2722A|nr:monovalent cation/H(+) antiporter subunit G [Sphaerobacter sp.]MBX5444244.1 monovalent cation/H(+) antiporter subunit G [Sphaerobacter sp.]
MLEAVVPWVADALVLLGLLILTLAVWGVLRMDNVYASLHAASKTTALGLGPLLIAAGLENGTILLRGLLVLGFLLLTAPVAAAAIARAYWRKYDQTTRPSNRQPEASVDASATADQHVASPD